MHRNTLEILACPSCRRAFAATAHQESDNRIRLGFLYCSGCGVTIPIVEGLTLFTEALLHPGLATAEKLLAKGREWFGSAEDFNAYSQEKMARGTLEAYSAFHPFNESTRALEPLLPYVRPSLQSGDFILDTWCRTGLSGEWLAGRFPANRVVSLWEGNSSVLGYRGFAHLLGQHRRAANLDIILTHPERPLPFADRSFSFLYALDSLHRYNLYPFAAECLRVSKSAAPVIFAHLHLSNSEPEPFFERGCRQLHGRDYRLWLDAVCRDTPRQGWVLSEADLFNGPTPAVLRDTPDTEHYNALICLLPGEPEVAMPDAGVEAKAAERYLVSPLFRFNLARSNARVAMEQHNGVVEHLLLRHPIYQQRLPEQPVALGDRQLALIFLAVTGKTQAEIIDAFSVSADATDECLKKLCHLEILQTSPVSATAHQLQRFHCNQLPPVEDAYQLFWSDLTRAEETLIILADGTAFSGLELRQLCCSFVASLPELGWYPGAWLSVSADGHPLLLLVALMACGQGINVRLAKGDIHPASICHVHVDGALFTGNATPELALGLDGAHNTLLSQLAVNADTQLQFDSVDALIEVQLEDALIACCLSDVVEACMSLQPQLDQQVWMSAGASPLRNLCGLIFAVTTQTPFRML